jgi:hypothetical protein
VTEKDQQKSKRRTTDDAQINMLHERIGQLENENEVLRGIVADYQQRFHDTDIQQQGLGRLQ